MYNDDSIFTQKQLEVLNFIKEQDPRITICYGAKRAGKTFALNFAYLGHIAEFQDMDLNFIIGGTSYASIQRNIVNDWCKVLGIKEFKVHKDNHINVLGNKVYLFNGSNAGSYEVARGFTAHGAFLNEATTLHETFVQEVISRCSGTGSRIYMDTNPENPLHFVKTAYIDKSGNRLPSGRLNIQAFHFKLDDNDKLDQDYMQSIKDSTPSGVFYDRDVLGLWVNAEGVIYRDFNSKTHVIDKPLHQCIRYFAGVDWGYSHKGSIVVVGMDFQNNFYVVEEITKDYKLIDWWVEQAKNIIKKYGNINFYADSARPEHVYRFQSEGINCINGNKAVMAGIETVSKLLIMNKFYLIKDAIQELEREFGFYVWGTNGEPLKENDDAVDALRYAIYSDYWFTPDCYKFI